MVYVDRKQGWFIVGLFLATTIIAANSYWIQWDDAAKNAQDRQERKEVRDANAIIFKQLSKNQRQLIFLINDTISNREIGSDLVKFIIAELIDIEQQQDDLAMQHGLNLTHDLVQYNGSHIQFGNKTIKIPTTFPNTTYYDPE